MIGGYAPLHTRIAAGAGLPVLLVHGEFGLFLVLLGLEGGEFATTSTALLDAAEGDQAYGDDDDSTD